MNILSGQETNTYNLSFEQRASYVYRFAILLAGFAFLNAIAILILYLVKNLTAWSTYAEIGSMLLFILLAIRQARQSRINFSDRTTFILIAGFLGILLIRNLFTAGMGLVFGLAAITVTPTMSILTLPTRRAGFIVTAGYVAGIGILLFDYYAPYKRPTAPQQVQFLAFAVVSIIVIYAIILIAQQFKKISLYSKLNLLFTIAVLIPVVVIGTSNVLMLRRELQARQNETLLGAASQAAIGLDAFVQNTLNTLRVEGQFPEISNYMQARHSNHQIDPAVEESILQTLQTLARKDPLFIKSYALLDADGYDILDTYSRYIGRKEGDTGAFQYAMSRGLPYMSDVTYDKEDQAIIIFTAPIRDANFHTVGVIRIIYKAYRLQILINEFLNLAGSNSFASILDENQVFIAHGKDAKLILKRATPMTPVEMAFIQMDGHLPPGTLGELGLNLEGMASGLENMATTPVFYADAYPKPNRTGLENVNPDTVAAVKIKSRDWIVTFSQSQEAYLTPLETQTRSTILLTVLILAGASVISLGVAQLFASPIAKLTEVANVIIEGNLTARAEVTSQDEIGVLAETFNAMTMQLSELIGSLEERVSERTQTLERRASLLQTAAEIGRLAANLRATDELLNQSVHLISEQFGFYHVGIFLLDERREFAVLRAANSIGGQRMLARNHRLRVGQVGIVGYVTARGLARIALDVGDDAVYFDNPDLPETRSEMALPLIAGSRVIGALDVQTYEAVAFTQDDIDSLQVLADLLTIAIENARLFEESQTALNATRSFFGEVSQVGWKNLIASRDQLGFLANSDGTVTQITNTTTEDVTKVAKSTGQIAIGTDELTASIPIVVRGQVIGTILLQKPKDSGRWNKAELDVAQALADQLSGALESARLYQDAQRKAMVEQTIGSIAGQMDAAQDIEGIMKTAVEEIGKLIGDASVLLELNPHTTLVQDGK